MPLIKAQASPGAAARLQQEFLELAARESAPVLLTGEPGSGKARLAQGIHEASSRRGGPLLMVDCALYYERELKRELFGYITAGADGGRARRGILEAAAKGSCYLSHVEELSPALQICLLDLLRTGRFPRLGDGRRLSSGARIIVSSEKNLAGFVESGLFDRDLYGHVSKLVHRVLPLRERTDEIPALVREILARRRERGAGTGSIEVDEEAMEALQAYPWPMNIDGLERELGRIADGGHSRITLSCLSMEIACSWRGRQCDPEVRRVIEELDAHVRELRAFCRIWKELGEEPPGWLFALDPPGHRRLDGTEEA